MFGFIVDVMLIATSFVALMIWAIAECPDNRYIEEN